MKKGKTWIRFFCVLSVLLFALERVNAGDILDSARAARLARLSNLDSMRDGYVERADRDYLVSYTAHKDISKRSISLQHSKLKETHGESLFLGEITHHTLWTGFSIAVNKKKALESHSSAARRLDAVAGEGAWLKAYELAILKNIRALPCVKTVHKVRRITAGMGRRETEAASGTGTGTSADPVDSGAAPRRARRLNATVSVDDDAIPTFAPTMQPSLQPTLAPTHFPTHMPYSGPNPQWFTRDPDVPLPWGLDRLDQANLPLDHVYNPQFNGTDVNVFVVDTGLDTKHAEFANTALRDGVLKAINDREVANIFDAYAADDANLKGLTERMREEAALYPSRNNDMVGHGTHVAATIGGNNVGVSPGCNLYGVRVLGANGSGSDEVIILGLLFVFDVYLNSGSPPSVINMSLGGTCNSYEECSEDALVSTVEKLAGVGLNVVVAAGNSGCDACLETPAFAANAITVGASDIHDSGAYFTDYGKCVDVYAPGVNITSACASVSCGGEQDQYTALSGTSMAAPHATGVLAQLLQLDFKLRLNALAAGMLNQRYTGDLLGVQLTCSASKQVLSLLRGEGDGKDKVSRNLLLQLPRVSTKVNLHVAQFVDLTSENTNLVCNVAAGCTNWDLCNGNGICQEGECLCDTGFWGEKCESAEVGFSCGAGFQYVPYSLFDLAGTGESWVGAEFRVQGPHTRPAYNTASKQWQQLAPDEIQSSTAGHFLAGRHEGVIPVLSSSMCSGSTEASGVCLAVTVLNAGGATTTGFATEEGESTAFTKDADGNVKYSYSVDVLPRSVMRGFSATWEMCGRRGGAPSRWEMQVYNPNDPFVHDSATNSSVHRNANDNYGAAADDDAWKQEAPRGTFNHNATYCSLECADLSAVAEINLYLQNPWAQVENDDTLVTKNVNIGTPAEMLQDGSPRPGTQSVPVGYSLLDARSGLEMAGGSWIMNAEVNDFLTEYMKVYFNDVDTPSHRSQLAALNRKFPLKQTHSFCVTAALLRAIQIQSENPDADTGADGNNVTLELALVTFGALSLQWSLAFEMCGVHIPALTDFSLFRFVFTRGRTGLYDSYTCAYVSETGEDLAFPTATPTAAPTAVPSAAAPTAAAPTAVSRRLGGKSLAVSVMVAAADTGSLFGVSVSASADSNSNALKAVKVGIGNALSSNFSVPVTAGLTAYETANTGWGWHSASYSLQSVRPSTQATNKVLTTVAECAQTLASSGQGHAIGHAEQCLHPLMVNTTLYNGMQEVQVQEWRIVVADEPGIHTAAPAGALPFYITCGVQAHKDTSSIKFKPLVPAKIETNPASFFQGITHGWSSLPSQPVPLRSAGVICERECVILKASGKNGVPLTQELADAVKPMLIVVGLNNSTAGIAKSELELQKLVGLVTKNRLCVGNATADAEESPQTCTTLIMGAGTQSLYPLWDLSVCELEHGYIRKGASIEKFKSPDKRQLYPSTAVVDICVTDWTDCKISAIITPDCSDAGMEYAANASPYHRDTRVYMYPPSRSNPFPPITRDVDKNGVDDTKQTNLVVKQRVRHGFYLYMYGDKGSWIGAQFLLFKAPNLGVNELKAFVASKTKRKDSNPSKVAQKLAGFNVTMDDDDTHTIGSDDDPFIRNLSRDEPFDLITSGSLDEGKDSAAAALCLTDGCYMLDVTCGKPKDAKSKNKGNLFIFCGKIGTVGDGAYVGIHDGECVVYPDLFQCQLTDAYYHLSADLWGMSSFFISVFVALSLCVVYFCCRIGYPAAETAQKYQILSDNTLHPVDAAEQQQPSTVRHENGYGSGNPLHRSQPREREVEMTPVAQRGYPGRIVVVGAAPSPVGALPDSTPDLFLDDIDTLGLGEEGEFSFGGAGPGGYNRIGTHSARSELKFEGFPQDELEFQTDFGDGNGRADASLTVQQRKANLSAALNQK